MPWKEGAWRITVLAGNWCQLTLYSRTEKDNSCPASLAAQNGKDSHAALTLVFWKNYNAAEVFLVRPKLNSQNI